MQTLHSLYTKYPLHVFICCAHLERVQRGLHGAVRQVHQHPQPVHLSDYSLNNPETLYHEVL